MKSLDTAHDHQHQVATEGPEAGSDRLPRRISRKAVASPQSAGAQLGSGAPYAWSFAGAVNAGIHVMRKDEGGGEIAGDAASRISAASSSSGSALPTVLQRKFEASLGADLSGVRVHTGAESAAASASVSARAYATGQDIHFGAGQYDPHSHAGEHLLAHEVAHTVQQQGGSPTPQYKLEVSGANDACEVEADRAADAMVSGQQFQIGGGSGVQRKIMRDLTDGTPTTTASAAPPGHDAPPTSGTSTGTTTGTGPASPGTGPVSTTWTVDYERVYTGERHTPGSRTDGTALQLNQFHVAPNAGDTRGADFRGLDLRDAGAVVMGNYAHPRNQGGRVTGRATYTTDRALQIHVRGAHGETRAIEQQVRQALDSQFVSDAQTQATAALTDDQRARGISVTASVRTGRARQVELSSATYGAITADGTQMNAVVTVPLGTTDRTTTSEGTISAADVARAGAEAAQSDATEASVSETERRQVTQQLERSFNEHVALTASQMVADATSHRTSSSSQWTLGGSSTLGISAEIPAHFSLGAIASRIPLVGRWLARALPEINFRLTPSWEGTASGQWQHTSEEADEISHNEEARAELQQVFERGLRQMWSQEVEHSLTHSLTRTHTQSTTVTGGREHTATDARRTETTVAEHVQVAAGHPQLTITAGTP